MALEQWEKDLRRQLSGVKAARREQWEDDLVQEIEDVAPRRRNSSKSNTTTFVGCLIMLGILTAFAYDQKSGAITHWWQTTHQNIAVVPPLPSKPQKSYDADIADLRGAVQKTQADLAAQQASLTKLESKTKYNAERITLTGMILNENFMIVRNAYDKNHLIFFNRDWTLDQMPHYLQLSDADKEYLKKYVKPQ